jgi:5S rRNA maturation endonuclease (ribonuclease M5)
MKNVTPKVFIATRFGLGVRNLEWFHHRMKLLKSITIPSLKNQTDKGYLWGIFVDDDIFPEILSELEAEIDSIKENVLILKGVDYKALEIERILKEELADNSGYFISSRLDDDDALNVNTIAEIRSKANEFIGSNDLNNTYTSYALTFVKGLEWVMYDMLDTWKRDGGIDLVESACVREYVRPFLGTSCIMIAPENNFMTFLDISHANSGLEDESSDCQSVEVYTNEYMWIYCRHKQSDSGIVKADRESRVNASIKDICGYFGMSYGGVKNYLNTHDEYSYIESKKSMGEKLRIQKQLNEALREGDELSIVRLKSKLAELSGKLLGEKKYQPLGLKVGIDGVVIDPVEYLEEECSIRLVIYDYNSKDYCKIEVIEAGELARIPYDFFSHENYKWKIQVKDENRWVDLFKYRKFAFPSQYTS